MIKCFFFDRDGVLIKNYGYFCNKDRIKWLSGAIKAIKILNKYKIKVVVVTNQSGIARGYFTENQLKDFHEFMNFKLAKYNAKINNFYYCPYHPKGKIKKYRKKTNLRKPGNKMIEDIKKRWKIDLKRSFMIGDRKSDSVAAKKSKLYFEYPKKNFYTQIKKIDRFLT